MIVFLKIAIFICGVGFGIIFTLIFWGDHRLQIRELNQEDSDRIKEIIFGDDE